MLDPPSTRTIFTELDRRARALPILAVLFLAAVSRPLAAAPAWPRLQTPQTSAEPTPSHGTITGTVVDAQTGAPLPGVRVTAATARVTVLTDAHGAFRFVDLSAGPETLVVSCVGYGLARPAVVVRAGTSTTVTVALAAGTSTYTDAVTVTPDRFRGADTAVASEQTVTSTEIQDLRGVLTDDPLRAIQALPGVATDNDFRSEFSVRGSDFRHMGLSLDGIETPWLVHSVRNVEDAGSVSLINGDIVDHATLEAGAYPQDRPERTGARLDYGLRDGSRETTSVRGAVSMTSASVIGEGPIGGSKRGSWLVSARESYVQWLLKRLDYSGEAFGFWDVQAKLTFDLTPREEWQVSIVGGRSELDQPGFTSSQVLAGRDGTALALVSWRSVLGGVVLNQRAAVLGDRFTSTLSGGDVPVEGQVSRSAGTDIAYAADASWALRPSVAVHAGVYVDRLQQADDLVLALNGPSVITFKRGTDGARVIARDVYGQLAWTGPAGLTIDTGVRMGESTLNRQVTATPWILGMEPLGRRWSLRAGTSVVDQTPGIDQVTGTFGAIGAPDEAARDVDAGVEYRPTPTLRVQVNAYDRGESDVLRFENSETRLVNGRVMFNASTDPVWRSGVDVASRGVEFVLQRRAETGLVGSVGYAYGRTRDTDTTTGETYWGDFDQRHTLNVYGEYRLSSRTSVSAKLRAGSNVPLTGYFNGDPTGTLAVGADRNTVRLPAYARLDLRANHTFVFTKRRLTLFVEIVNVLDRTNLIASLPADIAFSGHVSFATTPLFPILPSAGLVIEW